MRDIVTSVNMWLSSELTDMYFVFENGASSSFPSVIVTCDSIVDAGERRCSEAPLCEVKLTASVITDNSNSFEARDIACRIVNSLTGYSDRSVRIPMHVWDYESSPIVATRTIFAMEVMRVSLVDTFDAKNPEMRNVRIEFSLRARL